MSGEGLSGEYVYSGAELARERACRVGTRCVCDHVGCFDGWLDKDGPAERCPACVEAAEMEAELHPPPTRRRGGRAVL